MPRKKKPKEYEEKLKRLYGIRLRTKDDLELKQTLETISQETNMPLDQLMLTYLKKELRISQKGDINQENLLESFNNFFKKIPQKMESLNNALKSRDYEKKEDLKKYFDNKFGHYSPTNIQRQKFFLDLIQTQILSEKILLDLLFNLFDSNEDKDISYPFFYFESHDISKKSINTFFKDFRKSFFNEWYYELKLYGVINNIEEFNNVMLNYIQLERFIFSIYEGRKIRLSQKEKYLEFLQNLEDLKNINSNDYIKKKWYVERKNANNTKKSFLNNLKTLFTSIINHKGDEIRLYSDLFRKIGFKPHILYKIIDLDGYFKYLKDNNLLPNFSYAIQELILFYNFLISISDISPINLICQIESSFSSIEGLNNFLNKFPETISYYNTQHLQLIYFYLKFFKDVKLENAIWFMETYTKRNIHKRILKQCNDLFPNNYETIMQKIEDIFKKRNIEISEINRYIKESAGKHREDFQFTPLGRIHSIIKKADKKIKKIFD